MSGPEAAEERRRRLLRSAEWFEEDGPEAVAASRAMVTERALALARSLDPSDLDALSYRELLDLAALLAAARWSGPALVA